MSHDFCLILTDGDVTDAQCDALFESGLDDGTISTSCGVARIDVSRVSDSLENAVRSAIGQVNAAGLAVARVEIEAGQFAR